MTTSGGQTDALRRDGWTSNDRVTDVVRFADCAVDLGRFEIHRAGERVHVEPQVFDVLAYLIATPHRMVPKHELLD